MGNFRVTFRYADRRQPLAVETFRHDPSAGSDWMPSVAESAGSKSFSFCGYPPRLSVKTPTLFCVQYPSGHSMQPVAAGHRRHGSSSRLPTGVSARGGYG